MKCELKRVKPWTVGADESESVPLLPKIHFLPLFILSLLATPFIMTYIHTFLYKLVSVKLVFHVKNRDAKLSSEDHAQKRKD